MRGEGPFIWQLGAWPTMRFDAQALAVGLASLHEARGRMLAGLDALGPASREAASLACLTEDALRTSEIEGELLHEDAVRSSFARRLGVEVTRHRTAPRAVEGLTEMLLDALWKARDPLTAERLWSWHGALFPTGYSGLARIEVGCWRTAKTGTMRVVSGPHGRQKVHFEAPPAGRMAREMRDFLAWFDGDAPLDPVVRSGLAHLWFVTVHPFAEGNGRMARAIGDLALARVDGQQGRFYSVSAQIARERADYDDMLERTQRGTLDVTAWLGWYVACVTRAVHGGLAAARGVSDRAAFWTRHAGVPLNERQSKVLRRLLADFEGNLTAMKWGKLAKCSPDTALRDLNDLIAKGVLRKSDKGGRSTTYGLRG